MLGDRYTRESLAKWKGVLPRCEQTGCADVADWWYPVLDAYFCKRHTPTGGEGNGERKGGAERG